MNQQNHSCNCGRSGNSFCSCTQNQWVRRPWNTRSSCETCNQNNRSGSPRSCGACAQARTTCSCSAMSDATVWKRNCSGTLSQAEARSACPCSQARTETRSGCPCGQVRTETREGCSGDEDSDRIQPRTTHWDCSECNHGAGYESCLSDKSLAMVYSPYQEFHELYDPRRGLCNGTVFCELNKPFLGYGRCQ